MMRCFEGDDPSQNNQWFIYPPVLVRNGDLRYQQIKMGLHTKDERKYVDFLTTFCKNANLEVNPINDALDPLVPYTQWVAYNESTLIQPLTAHPTLSRRLYKIDLVKGIVALLYITDEDDVTYNLTVGFDHVVMHELIHGTQAMREEFFIETTQKICNAWFSTAALYFKDLELTFLYDEEMSKQIIEYQREETRSKLSIVPSEGN